ncbi:thiamine pyrophosphate-binding protein, partial [Demequina sp.]|uniref:thiamine pyrophosphate-binding protein n=1 Tax=Demequina sp. TaxID=2050685 RepID=UPI0025E41EB9
MSTHPSGEFARALVAALAQLGVEDYVLSPGSRSGPLAHALAEAAGNPPPGAPRVRLHVRIDERTAGFLALGIARGVASTAPRRPVAVVTTSGTAVGNLLPAVMEAHHSGVPLILLTADRPAELRGVGANQTTRQPGIFGTFVQWAEDLPAPEGGASVGLASEVARRAVTRALGDASRQDISGAPGPVHLNVAFRDPLGPDGGPWPDLPAVHPTPVAMASVAAPLAPLAQGVV